MTTVLQRIGKRKNITGKTANVLVYEIFFVILQWLLRYGSLMVVLYARSSIQ